MDINPNAEKAVKGARCAMPLVIVLLLDLLGVAVVMGVFCLYYFVLPRPIDNAPVALPIATMSLQASVSAPSTAQPKSSSNESAGTTTPAQSPSKSASAVPTDTHSPTSSPASTTAADQGMWGGKFADKFTSGDVVATENSYKSKDINVTISTNQSNGVTWYVANIYVKNLESFKTAFANDQYGKGIAEPTLDIANRNNAIVAVSGDFYGNHETGIVVRNGKLYRKTALDDVLVMNNDGSMQTFDNQSFQIKDVLTNGAWQAWSFGPMLLDNGQPMTKFNSNLNPANPRIAIGYYEPGHYCLVAVDGRQPGYSDGISLKDFSQLFYSMGCKAAYNLDGGQTAVMTFMGKWVNKPYKNGRKVSDIVYIGE